jgi:GT2 family glycosyltransferase
MVTWNRVNLTRLAIERLLSTKITDSIIHIIDNGSTDGTRSYLSHLSEINSNIKVFFLRKNYGIAVAANFGWSLIDTDYYVKIDNDIEILDANWLDYLVKFVEHNKEIGMLGYRLLEKHKIIPVYLPSGDLFHEFTGCGGGLVLIPRHIHKCCGFWTEDYGYYGFEDLDYGNRVVMSGYRVGYHFNENVVRHLGYEVDVNINQEKMKYDSINDITKGEKLYLLNKFLFEQKVRSTNVFRQFLPWWRGNDIFFRLNKDYLPIIKIQKLLMNNVQYSKDGDKVSLNFSSLKAYCNI